MPTADFRWLHISDLHVGVADQNWLWPTLKSKFFEDLRRLHSSVGPWDLVIFSGDCAQSGDAAEYQRVTEILQEWWAEFDKLGMRPLLFLTPGNHDIVRPPEHDAQCIVLKDWWKHQNVRSGFFSGGGYYDYIQGLFNNYRKWTESPSIKSITCANLKSGVLIGDASAVLTTQVGKVGIVGLNSTWLQIGTGDYRRRLHVDPRQLLSVTNNDPDAWCASNAFNILITHQPTTWLHEESLASWAANINLPSRFNLHLCGHMHEPSASSISLGGSQAKISLQAPSLFGLREVQETKTERIHGFYVGQIKTCDGSSSGALWPRKLRRLLDGQYKMGVDPDFDTDENGSINCFHTNKGGDFHAEEQQKSVSGEHSDVSKLIAEGDSLLEKKRYRLFAAQPHKHVRRIEQRRAEQSLLQDRAIWLISEWGMGADEFLANVLSHADFLTIDTFIIDVGGVHEESTVKAELDAMFDGGLARLWDALSRRSKACLIFDEIRTGQQNSSSNFSIENRLEEIIAIALDYCPNAYIVMRSRRPPGETKYSVVDLHPLDAGDMRSYLENHKRGGKGVYDTKTIDALHRHTDGVPVRIDISLKELDVVSLSELVNSSSDFTNKGYLAESSHALQSAIDEIAVSPDRALKRSYLLLKTLSVLPQGDQLIRIKRLVGNADPFFPPHAAELLDRALIESISSEGLRQTTAERSSRILRVPRLVRECVHERMKTHELTTMNRRAADLYFGPGWQAGTFRQSPAYRFDNPHRSPSDIINANTIILRLLKDAQREQNERQKGAAVGLANGYTAALEDGHHYRNIVSFCSEFLPLIDADDTSEPVSKLRLRLAEALRMTGDHDQAIEKLEALKDFNFSTSERASLLLALAMCYQSKGRKDDANETAKEIMKANKHSNSALQAKAILLENDPDDAARGSKLVNLERLARQRKANTVANNISIYLANNQLLQAESAEQELVKVLKNASDSRDYYNRMRAVVALCEMKDKAGAVLDEADLTNLAIAYQFLFNESFPNLFARCHNLLWKQFERQRDVSNLLVLFRQSSLVWRLNGDAKKEETYIQRLAKAVGDAISGDIRRLGREAAYYLVRASYLISPKRQSGRSPR